LSGRIPAIFEHQSSIMTGPLPTKGLGHADN
jgi:hypothetical protein